MKITVIGCGSIGKILLAHLTLCGHNTQGWIKSKLKSNFFVYVKKYNIDFFQKPIICNKINHLSNSKLIIVCLKAWNISNVILPLLQIIPKNTAILLLHNGMGVFDKINELDHPFLVGVTTHAAWQKNNKVFHVTNGVTDIGPINKAAKSFCYIANILNKAIPIVNWHDQISTICWRKLAVNCVINPLTVIYNCKNGDLKQYKKQINNIIFEIHQVMIKCGIIINKNKLIEYIYDTINKTTNNYSSMLQDIKNNKKTEIDYITGYIIKQAKKYNIKTPKNNYLYYFIKKIENVKLKYIK
ncbi:2-dehydropantoate 2-reductase [Candidatus Providencia siddallii]|uniref:2-dehydropantoate 2-reductase n=1 Tax=Candidatus Providencia siddallii TaxID=1715285 RepID=A0ABP1CFP3_9GAMM